MRWDAPDIARYARAAGFAGDDVTTATALALGTSGGNATYDARAGITGAGHWVGLWGVDIDRYPDQSVRDLHVPTIAADVAYELWHDTGGWEWSPFFRAGAHRPYVAQARVARTREYDTQRPAQAYDHHHVDRQLREVADRLARTRTKILTYRH